MTNQLYYTKMTKNYTNPLNPPLNCKPKQRQDWSRLYGSSVGLVISQAAQDAPLIVITPDSLSAQRLIEDIQFFTDFPVLTFPDWETLPYDIFSPHPDIISERLNTLSLLPTLKQGLLVLPVNTLMLRLPPIEYVKNNSLLLNIGQNLNPQKLSELLTINGYRGVSQVMEHGEFAIHGELVDLFPMGNNNPYRLDLSNYNLNAIRCFDSETQRTDKATDTLRLLPAREIPLTNIQHFRNNWLTAFPNDSCKCLVYQDVSAGLAPAGIEYYLPLFFEQTQSLFDYLPKNSVLFTLEGVLETAEQLWQEINQRYEQLRHQKERPILPPTQLFLQTNQVFAECKNYRHINLSKEEKSIGIQFATRQPPSLPVDARASEPLAALQVFIKEFQGRILIAAETTGRRESLIALFNKHDLKPTPVENWQAFLNSQAEFCITVAPLQEGLVLAKAEALDSKTQLSLFETDKKPASNSIAIISETQLFGERVAQRRLRSKPGETDAIVRDLTELTIGAPVVHETHGVGRYQGLVTLTVGGIEAEFLHLEYAKQDKLYVPVASLHLVRRFTGMDPEHAPLHRLSSEQWEKARAKAAQKASDVAAELLDIYARRAARKGHVFKIAQNDYDAFAQAFPFEETPDQQTAIESVLDDMYSERPMDRLICGDVGFGKTEVAMRAAFIAIMDGQQVAVLVPTTLLAQQHYQTFQDRFADWPVKIEQLSRFRSKKQQTESLKAIAEGQAEIVVGTHKLLQNNIKFQNLGLVIIDEEHRFGVKQKERFKSLRAEVDILTLTATPIPRSLNMALAKLRDLSIIATPPARRLAIKTFISEWQNGLLQEAILRELKRGGQIYFLHNDIESIEKMARELEELVPEARVQTAHGKMRERELETVMQDFYHRRFNVLVCTTIIETGIDIPTANTIIINRADKLGLAQLYQLRGRVGRSHHRAYAYLIIPPRKAMTKDAEKRIDAIGSLEELGMGFTLASHDLEIRGAGELLGGEQSGHIQEIGYDLYTELLERAVNSLESGQQPELNQPQSQGAEVNLHTTALLPNDYIVDVHTRLIMYKRIANAPNLATLNDIQIEMIDRFGLLPEAATALLQNTEIKLKSTSLGINKIDFGTKGGYISFNEHPAFNPIKLVNLMQMQPNKYKLDRDGKLHLLEEYDKFSRRCEELDGLLEQLSK